jgi:hypothetical protein
MSVLRALALLAVLAVVGCKHCCHCGCIHLGSGGGTVPIAEEHRESAAPADPAHPEKGPAAHLLSPLPPSVSANVPTTAGCAAQLLPPIPPPNQPVIASSPPTPSQAAATPLTPAR